MYDFTVLIPTHNRHNYLERSIEYYKRLRAQIIYCDSSEEPYKGNLAENILYDHLPDQTFPEKILTTLNKVESRYVALCADDDFLIFETLKKGYEFLDRNSDYSMVCGNIGLFHEKFDDKFYFSRKYEEIDLNSSPLSNLKSFFSQYRQLLWAMYSKEVLSDAFIAIESMELKNDNFIELTLGAISCYKGGLKWFNDVWIMRELSEGNHWGNRHKSIRNFHGDKSLQIEFRKFQEILDANTQEGFAIELLGSYLSKVKGSKGFNRMKYLFRRLIKMDFVQHRIKRKSHYSGPVNKYVGLGLLDDCSYTSIDTIRYLLLRKGE